MLGFSAHSYLQKVKYSLTRSIIIFIVLHFMTSRETNAQQFAADNHWVAPHGVLTMIGTAGQKYMMFNAVGAIIPEWEFNVQVINYYSDPTNSAETYTAGSFFVKHRLKQNEAETAGQAIMLGTGVVPQHLAKGEVTRSLMSWWALWISTYSFCDDRVLWDILPGATLNLDYKQSGNTAWGFTYSSRVAIYKIVPRSALVAEIFGTAGTAASPISYRAGIRWESPKWVFTGTYSYAFDGSYGAGFEIGFVFFTEPQFGNKKDKKDKKNK